MNQNLWQGLCGLFLALFTLAGAVAAGENSPYTVRQGDTLWSIASRFLHNPERWPDLWEQNKQLANPHLIYPGDQVFFYVDANGAPHLRVNQPPPNVQNGAVTSNDATMTPTILISPPVRQEEVLSNRQKDIIRQFLQRHSIIANTALEGDGYIIAQFDGHQVIGPGDRVFLKYSKPLDVGDSLSIYRSGQALIAPESREIIGHVIEHIGMVQVERMTEQGPVAKVTSAFDMIQPGDRLAPSSPINNEFSLFANSATPVNGTVLNIFDRLEQAGSNQIILINVGRVHKVTQGLILNIVRAGREVSDPLNPPNWTNGTKPIKLPSQRIATAALIYVGEQASYALLTHAEMPVQKGDQAMTH